MQASRTSSEDAAKRNPPAPAGGCYCSLWTTNPKLLLDSGVPQGYCGLCETCGAPGHTRHFPGVSPSTGTWCDAHYRRTMWLHPLGHRGRWVWAAMGAALVVLAVTLAR